jgi:hypothetical protein
VEVTVNKAGPITADARQAILQALRAGVVPKHGLQHLEVGRPRELATLATDIERIAAGGATLRLVIGDYGAGKTFLLARIRQMALDRGLVVINADLAPARRLHGADGEVRALLSELTQNLATRDKPEGGALADVVQDFIAAALRTAVAPGYSGEKALRQRLMPLEALVGGGDFALAVMRYARAQEAGDATGKAAALAWLRAEYATRAAARAALGVRGAVDDAGLYEHLKLLARFVVLAGYEGLVIMLDELGQLHRITNPQARAANYEQLLCILNDVLQGGASRIGFVLSGTPELLEDQRRGLFSDPALQSRLSGHCFARPGLVDLAGPVIRLENLTRKHLGALLRNIGHVFSSGEPECAGLPDAALSAFLDHCSRKIGDAYFRTPRQTVTAFVNLLSVLEQNPGTRWQDLLGAINVDAVAIEDPSEFGHPGLDRPVERDDDQLATFRL